MNLHKQFEKETGKKAPFHGDYLPYGNSFGFACAERDYYRFYTEWLEKHVKQIHKEYGCEVRDPYGTIWEYAKQLEAKVPPPLFEDVDCPECGGSGKYHPPAGSMALDGLYKCPKCTNGKIRKPIYYTPEAYESWMHDHGQPEFKILDTDPVWIEGIESPWFEWDWSAYKEFEKGEQCYMRLVGQPKPNNDWRPE